MSLSGARLKNVGVFCGSRTGISPAYVESARSLGAELARRGAGLVYGAGGVGVMGALAAGALSGGARVTGVIPHDLYERERPDLTKGEIYVARTMHERKALMYRLSDGFAVLPGGFGTLDELFEILTLLQTRKMGPVPVVLFDEHYWRSVVNFEALLAAEMVDPEDLALFDFADTAEEAWQALIRRGLKGVPA